MLKFGVTNLSQITSNKLKSLWGWDKKISITLYEKIHELPDADALAERILLLFSDERGAYKRTYHKRFEEFDAQIINVLARISPLQTFHDVGVSDGRTALDFFEKMVLAFPDIHYFASDYNPSVFVLEKGKLKVTLSQTGNILEILFHPFVFNKIKRENFFYYPLNHLACFLIRTFWVNPLLRAHHEGRCKPKELLLFAPKVVQKAHQDKRFQLGQHDLLQPFKKHVDIIRAMNVLNPSYFSDLEFRQVIRNLYDGLREDGLLITGSNQEAGTVVSGGIYQKSGKGFKKLFESEGGAPVEGLLLTFKA